MFKIGDKVKIKSLEWYEHNKNADGYVGTVCGFWGHMCKYCGKEAVITDTSWESYRVDIDGGLHVWDDEMFENTEEENKRNLIELSISQQDCIISLLLMETTFLNEEKYILQIKIH